MPMDLESDTLKRPRSVRYNFKLQADRGKHRGLIRVSWKILKHPFQYHKCTLSDLFYRLMMLNSGQNPAGEGGFRGGWKGCTTRVPQFIMARTVWHKQGGLDRTVLKKPREGINDSEDLWPPSPPREREIVMQRLSPDCLFFYLFLSFVISFHSNNRTSYKATAVRPTRP